ncbi:MAG: AtpZ/AtpI family protein [Flavobacteriales bacterium]|nr:AtpZ/AtpI family protein [Flavobacteriales bacterium]
MILIVVVGIVGGYLVDDYFQKDWPIFAVIFGIMGAFIASFMYNMYKEENNDSEKGE